MYIVILSNLFEQGVAKVAILDAQFNVVNKGLMNEVSILQQVTGCGVVPLNFQIRDGRVVDCFGKFTRFGNGQYKSLVVVARLLTNGRTVGYRVVATNNGVVANLKLADILDMCKSQNAPLTQNMMFRQGSLTEYSGLKIPTVEMPKTPTSYVRHKVPATQSTINYDELPAQPVNPEIKTKQQHPDTQKHMREIVGSMSDKQKREVKRAIDAGVDPTLLADKDLTPQQMRVLWMSKQWGCKSEAFAGHDYGVDVMKFYADRLYSDDLCDKCKPILNHPELSLNEVSELYLCALADMDVNELIGKSANDIQIAYESKTRDYWCNNTIFGDDPDYYQKALHVAMEVNAGEG